ncbi:WD40 repeat domain-containing protein [Streptomyces pseudovenezuelae]|uniref:WD40 repeat protein n=1 Tax=Streptomyces pseudovenezuelae TaxID=67350 RepID=A0ABT6LZD0_9ACTN|nr:PQQ-binding-like beta-propeller repeat protein [Streptomyces pseudovenezuelae]MDH6221593.1 WD40 repeat protein [Streptomyces pseudovenezuelae]
MRTISLPANPTGHSAPVTHVAFSSDGRHLASCSYDGSVLVWDTTVPARPRIKAQLRHRRLVNASAWNPVDSSLLATASADKTAGIWRISEEGPAKLVNVLARHTDDINSVAWMPDGERLICVSEDGRATLWNALAGTFLGEVGSHAAHCMMVSVSPGGLVATVGEDGMVAVSDPDSEIPPATRHYASSVEGCAWSHDGKTLAIACDDGSVSLLTGTLQPVLTVQVSESAARAVSWADDDETFAVGAYDGFLHVYSARGTALHKIYDARVWPRSVSVVQGTLAAGSFWNAPHLLDLASAARISGPDTPNHGTNAMALMGDELLLGCDSGSVLAVDLATAHDTARQLHVTEAPILSLITRGVTLYAGTYSGHVVRYEDGTTTSSQKINAPIPSLCHDGERIVAGTYNGELVGLDPQTLNITDRSAAHEGSVKSLATSGSGFLSAATDRTVAGGSFQERTTLWEHGNLVNAVAALGAHVAASASRDHTVKVGRFETTESGEQRLLDIQTLLGPDESVKCVALVGAPEAPFVLAGSYDFGLYAWHIDWRDNARTLASGQLLAEFTQGLSCMIALDNSRVAVAGWDGRVLVVGQDANGRVSVQRTMHVDELAAAARAAGRAVTA